MAESVSEKTVISNSNIGGTGNYTQRQMDVRLYLGATHSQLDIPLTLICSNNFDTMYSTGSNLPDDVKLGNLRYLFLQHSNDSITTVTKLCWRVSLNV